MTLIRLTLVRLTLIAMTAIATGCSFSASYSAHASTGTGQSFVEVPTAPPALRPAVATRPPRPNDNSVWVSGHWSWNGSWVWVDGHWQVASRGRIWQPPVCVPDGNQYRYYPGYFRPETFRPRHAYRNPESSVPVSVTTPETRAANRVVVRRPPPRRAAQASNSGNGGSANNDSSGGGSNAEASNQNETRPTSTVRPAVVRQGTTKVTPAAGSTNASNTNTTQGSGSTGSTPRVSTAGGSNVAKPGTAVPTSTVRPGVARQGTTSVTPRITCATEPRGRRGQRFEVKGSGFGPGARVAIGTVSAKVVRVEERRLEAELPRGAVTGEVTVKFNGQTARCGQIRIQ